MKISIRNYCYQENISFSCMPRKKLAYYGYTKHRLKTFLSFHAFSLTLIGADFFFF